MGKPNRGNHVGSERHCNARFVGLVQEVPNVDACGFSDPDDARSAGAESAAGVVGIHGVAGAENGEVGLLGDFPKGEVEIMNCHDKIIEER